MKATELIRFTLNASKGWAMMLIDDIKDEPLVQPTPHGGNHPLWTVGHLAYSEAHILDEYLLGRPNRYAELAPLFKASTTPVTDAAQAPPIEELLAKFEAIRAATLAHLDTLTDDDLDSPSHAPPEMAGFFGKVGGCFAAMSTHVSFHAGQVADARRAAGRKPLLG